MMLGGGGAPALGQVPSSAPPSLVEIFSPQSDPGRGTLLFQKGNGAGENIVFGKETGHYALGMVFAADTLPEALKTEFKGNQVIQLAWGTVAPKVGPRIPQFGAVTLMVTRGHRAQRVVPLRIPEPSQKALPETGFLLFSSPSMPREAAEEQRLKGTFFAQSGSMAMKFAGKPVSRTVNVQGATVTFAAQAVEVEVQATLLTPFSPEQYTLRGRLELPLYTPQGKEGRQLARRLTETSLNAAGALSIPQAQGGGRHLSSQPKAPSAPQALPPSKPKRQK